MDETLDLKKSKGRILIADDEEILRTALQKSLEKEGFEVVGVGDGTAAQALIDRETFDAVISDIHMPTGSLSGIELLKYIKQTKPMPVILMTGFASLTETHDAHEMGADGFLAKPFRKEELLQLLAQITQLKLDFLEHLNRDQDKDYCKLSVDDFAAGREITFSIYIRLKNTKYVKIAHHGQDIAAERIQSYKKKGLQYLYLTSEDFRKYLEYNSVISKSTREDSGMEIGRKMELLRHANEVVLEHFHNSHIDSTAFEDARSVVESTVSVLLENDDTYDFLDGLNRHCDRLYAHSLGVCLYSSLIAKRLQWQSPQDIFKLSIAGLLHDIGKREIPKEILNKPEAALTPKELELLESHSARGMEILSTADTVPTEVVEAVLQHHENCLGTGYPSKISKANITPMAKLIAVCDEFCELAVSGPNRERLTPHEALRKVYALHGQRLDATYLVPLAEILKMDPKLLAREAGIELKVD